MACTALIGANLSLIGASHAFLMPYGHPATYLVQEPGGYTAGNYFKFGIGLNLIAFAVILLLVPLLWHFRCFL